jgi:hypothetical protein
MPTSCDKTLCGNEWFEVSLSCMEAWMKKKIIEKNYTHKLKVYLSYHQLITLNPKSRAWLQ